MSRSITEILSLLSEIQLSILRATTPDLKVAHVCVVCGGDGCPECFDTDGYITESDTTDGTL